MSPKWITVNPRLKNGITLINSLPPKKFQQLLYHIINSKTEDHFTEVELQKLKDTLKLSDENLQLLIQSITFIFKQSSKVILKPTVLQKQLCEDLNFHNDKAEEFVKLWSIQAQKDVGDLGDKMKLNDVTWELNLQVADQIQSKQNLPLGRIQLSLEKVTDNTKKQNVTIELNKEQLTQLYNSLETIQIKLDNIQSVGINQ